MIKVLSRLEERSIFGFSIEVARAVTQPFVAFEGTTEHQVFRHG